MFYSSLSGLLDTLDQRIIFVIESQSPGTINDPSLDMSSKVHLYNITISRTEKAIRQHKELVHQMRTELLEKCELNAGREA